MASSTTTSAGCARSTGAAGTRSSPRSTATCPSSDPVGASAGLHVLAWLPQDLDEGAVVTAAATAGIGLAGLAPRKIDPTGPGGLIFGYGAIIEEAIDPGVRQLARIVTEVRRTTTVAGPAGRRREHGGDR